MVERKYAKESRRASRYRHDSVLEIVGESSGAPVDAARLVDVSSGGVSFSTTRVYAKGARIRARMRLLDAGPLEFIGKVVRIKEKSNSTLYAVEFESVRGAHR